MVTYGLIGRGLSHSFSASYFNDKFEREGIDARYMNFDLEDITELPGVIAKHPDLNGLNVTTPYKRDVIGYMDELSEEAAALQSVNVIEFKREQGELLLKGHNTDSPGFRQTLEGKIGAGERALIMGTGGAASAVAHALKQLGAEYKTVSRTPDPEKNETGYERMSEILPSARLIVNATPLGMYPKTEACPPVDLTKIGPGHIAYDLIYNPAETLFLKRARENGAMTINGLQMLINQAELSWQIWNHHGNTP